MVHTICVLHKNGCYSTRMEIIERITTIKGSQVTVREALSEQFKILENSDVVGERFDFERCVFVVKLSHKIQVLIKFVTKKALKVSSVRQVKSIWFSEKLIKHKKLKEISKQTKLRNNSGL